MARVPQNRGNTCRACHKLDAAHGACATNSGQHMAAHATPVGHAWPGMPRLVGMNRAACQICWTRITRHAKYGGHALPGMSDLVVMTADACKRPVEWQSVCVRNLRNKAGNVRGKRGCAAQRVVRANSCEIIHANVASKQLPTYRCMIDMCHITPNRTTRTHGTTTTTNNAQQQTHASSRNSMYMIIA